MDALEELEPTDRELAALEDGEDASGPVRLCRGCSTPITGHQSRIWCSDRCRRAHSQPAAQPRAGAVAVKGDGSAIRPPSSSNGANGHRDGANGVFGLAGALLAAFGPGAELVVNTPALAVTFTPRERRNL